MKEKSNETYEDMKVRLYRATLTIENLLFELEHIKDLHPNINRLISNMQEILDQEFAIRRQDES